MLAYRSNSGRSGKGGKMLGSMSACMRVASASSAPMRSFSAVMRVICLMYSWDLADMSAKDSASISISSPVR